MCLRNLNFSQIVSTDISLLFLAKKIEIPKRKYKVTFVNQWLEDDRFKIWLRKVEKDIYSAKCSIFCKTFDISNTGKSALTSHVKGKKHCEWAPSVYGSRSCYFSKSESTDLLAPYQGSNNH